MSGEVVKSGVSFLNEMTTSLTDSICSGGGDFSHYSALDQDRLARITGVSTLLIREYNNRDAEPIIRVQTNIEPILYQNEYVKNVAERVQALVQRDGFLGLVSREDTVKPHLLSADELIEKKKEKEGEYDTSFDRKWTFDDLKVHLKKGDTEGIKKANTKVLTHFYLRNHILKEGDPSKTRGEPEARAVAEKIAKASLSGGSIEIAPDVYLTVVKKKSELDLVKEAKARLDAVKEVAVALLVVEEFLKGIKVDRGSLAARPTPQANVPSFADLLTVTVLEEDAQKLQEIESFQPEDVVSNPIRKTIASAPDNIAKAKALGKQFPRPSPIQVVSPLEHFAAPSLNSFSVVNPSIVQPQSGNLVQDPLVIIPNQATLTDVERLKVATEANKKAQGVRVGHEEATQQRKKRAEIEKKRKEESRSHQPWRDQTQVKSNQPKIVIEHSEKKKAKKIQSKKTTKQEARSWVDSDLEIYPSSFSKKEISPERLRILDELQKILVKPVLVDRDSFQIEDRHEAAQIISEFESQVRSLLETALHNESAFSFKELDLVLKIDQDKSGFAQALRRGSFQEAIAQLDSVIDHLKAVSKNDREAGSYREEVKKDIFLDIEGFNKIRGRLAERESLSDIQPIKKKISEISKSFDFGAVLPIDLAIEKMKELQLVLRDYEHKGNKKVNGLKECQSYLETTLPGLERMGRESDGDAIMRSLILIRTKMKDYLLRIERAVQ